ncbi:TerB family tellurite resistance protein [Spongiibacter sp. KMU-158]|uniref:TerB family tellurite resistance protein n=1 Tax=Spongiibacter pelagi TaxID=2760804 RepID=A0A927GVK7_9GAMM|nr:TerB family tellurite resistance protein [Spongiibacter pelagi]MBD2858500.1 TerB family tellurite resistance protein [Spongiibacter pelagi]
MFDVIKKFFSADEAPEESMSLALAAGALLMEVSKADYSQDASEVDKIRELLVQHYQISLQEIEGFIASVQGTASDSTALYPFTRYINDNCSIEEKYQLVHALWTVAAEDGVICKYEEHLIRKISDLIYLPHREFIRAKLDVTDSL